MSNILKREVIKPSKKTKPATQEIPDEELVRMAEEDAQMTSYERGYENG